MKRVWILWMFVLLGLGVAQSAGSFVGKVEDGKSLIAIVISADQKVMAYVCDSADLAQWFTGKLEGSSFKIVLPSGRSLEGTLDSGGVSGNLGLEGKTLGFKTSPNSGQAGLYRYAGTNEGNAYLGGWIIDQEGQQRGSVIGGGGPHASLIVAQTLKSDFPALQSVLAFLVTPEWVSQNINL